MQRKVVTVLFCDVVASTELGDSTDPETLQGLLAAYFRRMSSIVEAHGGTVEKFIGDAVMAVFGVPQVHEDDALRACRAAVEMRAALPELGLEGRVGVNTGEVVTGTEERLVTGDAVNVAARLQQAADPGEVLIGEQTLALARGAVEVGARESLDLKGKAQPVTAFKLVSVEAAPERAHAGRFVGRGNELEVIGGAWQRALAEARCEVVTVVGDAGVGKSRLVSQALGTVDGEIFRGRCLPYGEGITYWPVVEVLKQLDAFPSDPAAAAAIRSLLGLDDAGTSSDQIAWGVRKLLEEQAPLAVVFDDLQWGEETFLDLVEGIALLSAGAPILVVCMARPELLDRRPQWSVTIRLKPLDDSHVDELIGGRVPPELRGRIARAAGGNPLYVTEMLAMAERTQGEVDVPGTLKALLAARLDQLEPAERSVLERGAVEGEIFHRGSVQALAPDDEQVTPRLAALVRRELIRPDRPQFPREDGFRFWHLLIRDAAYNSLSKATRAELHARFADWLEQLHTELVELDEIVGYHLELAAAYRAELGTPDQELAARAGTRLAAAGWQAVWRVDHRAAARLFERALALTRPTRFDVHLELAYAASVRRRDPRRAAEVVEEAVARAEELDDELAASLARAIASRHRGQIGEATSEEAESFALEALPLLEEAGDHAGLARIWRVLGDVANIRGRYGDCADAYAKEAYHSELAGWHVSIVPDTALRVGPQPADEALQVLDNALGESPSPYVLLSRSVLLGMLERFEEAWSLAHESAERVFELRGGPWGVEELAALSIFAGDHEAAARHLKDFCDLLETHEEREYLSTYAPQLARELCALGKYADAEPLALRGRELGAENDTLTQLLWRQALALVLANRGDFADAERLVREAIVLGDSTDALGWQADARWDLATILIAAGRIDEAIDALEQALALHERKQNLAMARRVRGRLADLAAGAAAV